MFSEKEIHYLKSQRLARIATVSKKLQPDVAPVAFEFDGKHFYIGGLQQTKTNKYRNVADGNTKVALVVDDLKLINPWKPRGIKVHGTAEIVECHGKLGTAPYLKVTTEKYWSWGIEQPVFEGDNVVMKKKSRGQG